MPKCHLGLPASNPSNRNEARAVRGRPLRLAALARDHRNDHRADGAADRPQDSRYGHHAAPLHVRSLDRARACSGLEVCIARDLSSRSRSHARPRDPRACDGDGHREDSPHGRHGELQCARNPGHAYECGWRDVSRYMRSCKYPFETRFLSMPP
jgi:hypothetical protein